MLISRISNPSLVYMKLNKEYMTNGEHFSHHFRTRWVKVNDVSGISAAKKTKENDTNGPGGPECCVF